MIFSFSYLSDSSLTRFIFHRLSAPLLVISDASECYLFDIL